MAKKAAKKRNASKKVAKRKVAAKSVSKSSARTSKAKSRAGEISLKIGQEIWPVERDVLFRPDRMKYVRKLIKSEGCVFCRAATEAPTFETLCLYRSKLSMIVANKFPYNTGHILILPRRHCGDPLALSDAEFEDLNKTLRLAIKALNEVYEPGGMNMGLNMGATGGAGIPEHLHYHLIPRWAGDLNFFPLIAETKVLVESLEQTFDKLSSYFKKHE